MTKLCCLVNWIRRCDSCDWALCNDCWIEQFDKGMYSSKHHSVSSPGCRGIRTNRYFDGSIAQYDVNGKRVKND